MEVHKLVQGMLENNVFVVAKNKTNILIDPGLDQELIEQWLIKLKIIPDAILLTHGHFDHIASAKYFQDKFNIKIYFGQEDQFYLDDPFGPLNSNFDLGQNLELNFTYQPTKDTKVKIKDIDVMFIKTPGHTPGSTCYFFEEISTLFTGDTLFFETIGRTDFKKGDIKAITKSIQEKLYILNDKTKIWPGHGRESTIKHEKLHNQIVREKENA